MEKAITGAEIVPVSQDVAAAVLAASGVEYTSPQVASLTTQEVTLGTAYPPQVEDNNSYWL